ncbi:reverse transcriptase domain-containing protein [Tanacetum coccineum]
MLLNFSDDIKDTNDEEHETNMGGDKGKTTMTDEDLSKPFKEVLKCPFTRRIIKFSSSGHRMPTNVKIYDRTNDPKDHISECLSVYVMLSLLLAIFHDMIEESVEVFMDDFSIFGNSFDNCLNNLDKMLQRCKDANLVLNWEKCHFMVKEGIVPGHKVSDAGLEVDKAKIDIISELPPLLVSKPLEVF